MKLPTKAIGLAILGLILIFGSLISETRADPVGVAVTNISSVSSVTSPESRVDEGGTITTMVVDAIQQNFAWKAYVGNITASLTLDDGNGQTIYDWTISQDTLAGELYASRASSVSWSSIGCANDSVIATEHTAVNMGPGDSDNINKTFNYTRHPSYVIAGTSIGNSTCKSLYTFKNETRQANDENGSFSQILIQNGDGELVYVTKIEQDEYAYSQNSTQNVSYDFQMLVADDDTASQITTYYFYAEIDS